MKRMLLSTPLGGFALNLRDKAGLVSSALKSLEPLGTLANDLLASRLVTGMCRPGFIFLDVGAHIGSIVHQVRRSVPSARIVAFEAMPDKAASLRKRFPEVDVFHCAAGDQDGEMSFFVNRKQSGYSSLLEPAATNRAAFDEITVPVKRIDGLLQAADIDVMKIDVEGAELGVLRGCTAILEACRPIVMFESAPADGDDASRSKGELFEFLLLRNFEVLVPNRLAHNGPALSADGFMDSHFYPRRTTNYFAVPRERRLELRDKARTLQS